MKIRPHHLLCMQSFIGKGYSDEFVENMKGIIEKYNAGAQIQIVLDRDSICESCPKMNAASICESQAKVTQFDHKVMTTLGIEQRFYAKQEVMERLKSKLTPKGFAEICGECEWYENKVCTFEAIMKGGISFG